ncbi:hypothetical protein OSB04_023391 [Centaurea solstitialis]|uniref:Uncharacterized protein n=1 Tax=Centaurea solstitialis TaxID=347529 RepID=A0AA38SKQ9_9ASTR|nr:hypothetical protein OSB04_023391 [Centaurea solstitialis]
MNTQLGATGNLSAKSRRMPLKDIQSIQSPLLLRKQNPKLKKLPSRETFSTKSWNIIFDNNTLKDLVAQGRFKPLRAMINVSNTRQGYHWTDDHERTMSPPLSSKPHDKKILRLYLIIIPNIVSAVSI